MEKISQKGEEQGGRADTGAAWPAAGDNVGFFTAAGGWGLQRPATGDG